MSTNYLRWGWRERRCCIKSSSRPLSAVCPASLSLSLSLVASCTLSKVYRWSFFSSGLTLLGRGLKVLFSTHAWVASMHLSLEAPTQKPAGVCPGWRPEVERKLLFGACRLASTQVTAPWGPRSCGPERSGHTALRTLSHVWTSQIQTEAGFIISLFIQQWKKKKKSPLINIVNHSSLIWRLTQDIQRFV